MDEKPNALATDESLPLESQPSAVPQEKRESLPPPSRPASTPPVGPSYWQKPKRRWLHFVVIFLFIILIAGGLYWLWQHPKKAQNANTPSASTAASQKPATQTQQPATTTHYDSSNFNLGFDYPKDWTVTDSGNNQLTVRSSVMTLMAANGQSVNGQILMTISPKGQNLAVFNAGDATAVMDSKKITYSKPTQSQRANTYISFLQYANTRTTGALDAIDITGNYGYTKGQDIPKTDVAGIDPLVSVTFLKCVSSACPPSSTTAMSITSSSWDDSLLSTPVTKMLESLSFN